MIEQKEHVHKSDDEHINEVRKQFVKAFNDLQQKVVKDNPNKKWQDTFAGITFGLANNVAALAAGIEFISKDGNGSEFIDMMFKQAVSDLEMIKGKREEIHKMMNDKKPPSAEEEAMRQWSGATLS